jgi:DNA-binding GntR family transcriptional regulator
MEAENLLNLACMQDRETTAADSYAHERVYARLSEALAAGRFVPGERLTLRGCADMLGVSPMPVREAMRRLVAEGALIGAANRSVRVPALTRERILELRDIRLALEGLAAERAAANPSPDALEALRAAWRSIYDAREAGDTKADMEGVRRFHFCLYAASGLTSLLEMIASVWLRAGSYRYLLYPTYIQHNDGRETRQRIIAAFEQRDGPAVRALVCGQIAASMTWAANQLHANQPSQK